MARSHSRKVSTPIVVATAISGAVPAVDAADYYLKFGDIEGDVALEGYEGQIEIDAFSFGASQEADSGRISGRTVFRSLRLSKSVDRASAYLFKYFLSPGSQPVDVELSGVVPGSEAAFKFFDLKFEDVIMTSINFGGEGDTGAEKATETITITFSSGCLTTYELKQPGVTECFEIEPVK